MAHYSAELVAGLLSWTDIAWCPSRAGDWTRLYDVPELRGLVDALPDEQREVLALVAIAGMAYKDAAEMLQLPIGTVMSRLARARALDRMTTLAAIRDITVRDLMTHVAGLMTSDPRRIGMNSPTRAPGVRTISPARFRNSPPR